MSIASEVLSDLYGKPVHTQACARKMKNMKCRPLAINKKKSKSSNTTVSILLKRIKNIIQYFSQIYRGGMMGDVDMGTLGKIALLLTIVFTVIAIFYNNPPRY